MSYLGYFKCPECGATAVFKQLGPYRAICKNCNSVVTRFGDSIEKEK